MSAMLAEPSTSDARCNTCKAVFSSVEKVKDHYRGDWHVFNSKRRANNLVPLSKEDYKRIAPTLPKRPTSLSTNASVAPSFSQSVSSSAVKSSPKASGEKGAKVVEEPSLPTVTDEDCQVGLGDDDEEEEVEEEELPNGPNFSIFNNKEFETTDESVEYMAVKFGFFIPDAEYLVDLDGLLTYLGEKVKVGGVCLYCQKQFRNGRACQNHMRSKSHCKIAYEEGVDADEFEDFFDFSSSYENEGPEEYDEDGNLVQKTIDVSNLGELVLMDGRTVGHRAFRTYYKQYFRPEDDRPSVLAQQREELLRLGHVLGGGRRMTNEDVLTMTDTQVMTALIKKQKVLRKTRSMAQRAEIKGNLQSLRREFQSTKDKLRSAATTTEKIRDYHRTLM